MANYVELAEGYVQTTARIRALPTEARSVRVAELAAEARESVARIAAGDHLEKLAIWHADYFYRVLNSVTFLDDASFAVAAALGSAVSHALTRAGKPIAYLVDNGLPHDRLVPGKPFFSALGFVVASPELWRWTWRSTTASSSRTPSAPTSHGT